jgi:hypothetical protein
LATISTFILPWLASVFSWLAFIVIITHFLVAISLPSIDPSHP